MGTELKTILWSELLGKATQEFEGLKTSPEELSLQMGTVFRTNLWLLLGTVFRTILWSELLGKDKEGFEGLQSIPEELSPQMGTAFRTNLCA